MIEEREISLTTPTLLSQPFHSFRLRLMCRIRGRDRKCYPISCLVSIRIRYQSGLFIPLNLFIPPREGQTNATYNANILFLLDRIK